MIQNGKDQKIGVSGAGLPSVTDAVAELLQPIEMGIIQKQQIDGYTQEVAAYQTTMASIQPMAEALAIRKEGEWSWRWFIIHVLPDIQLATDDVFVIDGTRYRIMQKYNWAQYGFIEYHCIEDYNGKGAA